MIKAAIYNRILEYGGVSEVSIKLYEGLKENLVDTELVTINNSRNYLLAKVIKGNDLIFELLQLIRFIKNSKINVIIINPCIHIIIIKLYSILTFKKIKVITMIHMRPKFWLLNKTINNKVTNFITRIGVKTSDEVIAVSNDLKNELIEKSIVNKNKVKSIYNPIVINSVKQHSYKDVEAKKYIDLVIVGWITKLKGQAKVVEALNLLNDKRYRLNIIGGVGDENYYNELLIKIKQYKLEENVKFWGEISDVRSVLSSMDIYILASESEALPTVLIEALECGVPIIASNCKWGPKEILKKGKYGELYDKENYKELSEKIRHISEDNKKYNQFRGRAYERANDFTKENSINEYVKIINNFNI